MIWIVYDGALGLLGYTTIQGDCLAHSDRSMVASVRNTRTPTEKELRSRRAVLRRWRVRD